MMLKTKKHQWWAIIITITAALVIKTYLDDSHENQTKNTGSSRDTLRIHKHRDSAQNLPELLALDKIRKTRAGSENDDLFQSKSWYVPPPPPPPAPPPTPVAPPLPFSILGKVREPNGRQTLFLSDKSHVYLVHGGETLDKKYHVDGIENGKLAITYLPLNKKQYLNLVEAN